MTLKNFSKEQKQYAVLGLLAVAILVILVALGVRFSMGTISVAKDELYELTTKIDSAEQALSKSQKTSEEYAETIDKLRKYLRNAPPERNCYSWATEVIYSKSRLANLEIDSIEELSYTQLRQSSPKGRDSKVSFESYSVRISAHGGYENTKYFLHLFEQDYPLVRFSGLEISSGNKPDVHDIQLYMQWPYNFGEVTNNWDVVTGKTVKTATVNDGEEPGVVEEPAVEPANESTISVQPVTKPDPVREPYPPTSRPQVEEAPASKPVTEPAAATQPGINDSEEQAEPPSVDGTLKEAVADETEPVSEPEILVEPVADVELQTVAQPATVVGPQLPADSLVDPASEPTTDQDLLEMMGAVETSDSAQLPEEPTVEVMEAEPQLHAVSTSNLWSQSSVGSQTGSVSVAVSSDVETGKNEQINEEPGSKDSAQEGVLWSAFLDDLKEENNEN